MELLGADMAMDGWTFVSSFASKALGPLVAAKDVVLRRIDEIGSFDDINSEEGDVILEYSDENIEVCMSDNDANESEPETFCATSGIKIEHISATTILAKLDLSIDGRPTLETVESFLKRLKVEEDHIKSRIIFEDDENPALIFEDDESTTAFGESDSVDSDGLSEETMLQEQLQDRGTTRVAQVVDFGCQTNKTFEDGSTQTDISSFYVKPSASKTALRLLEETLLRLTSEDDDQLSDSCEYDDDNCDMDDLMFSPCLSPRFAAFNL